MIGEACEDLAVVPGLELAQASLPYCGRFMNTTVALSVNEANDRSHHTVEKKRNCIL